MIAKTHSRTPSLIKSGGRFELILTQQSYYVHKLNNIPPRLTLVVITLIVLTACGSKPSTEPQLSTEEAKAKIKEGFTELNTEVGVTEVEKDLSGVESAATGEFNVMESLVEPDAAEMIEYETGKPGWIEVAATRIFPESVSNLSARQELLNILRNEAVSKKVPRTIEVSSLLTDIMSETAGRAQEQTAWSSFFKSTVTGMITSEKIVSESDPKFLQGKNSFEKSITLKAYVEPVKGNRDPAFSVKAELQDNTLSTGDELNFYLTPSQESYLYVFNLMADHSVLLVFPNDYMPDNHLKAGETVQFPDPKMRGYIRFRVGTLPSEKLTTESIYVVCTKDPVTVADKLPRIGTGMPTSGDSKSFVELQRWLTNIPLNRRVEKNLVYFVAE
ncbi:MAG: DUF4384 domain-containing protein [Fidelibacterota bacterium]